MSRDRLCRWAGWGRDAEAMSLAEHPKLVAHLRSCLGDLPDAGVEAAPISSLEVAPGKLGEEAVAEFVAAVGDEGLRTDAEDRIRHSFGKSYRDLVRARSGAVDRITDAVIYPTDAESVARVLDIAGRHGVAVIPFGGGTSVVGGVEPRVGEPDRKDACGATITLDTRWMNGIELDEDSQLAEVGAGVMGPDLEEALGAHGYTLGHFPQSFEFSTMGGWVAARGAGQQSTRYGKIEEMVQSVRLVSPAGEIVTRNVPATAAGPGIVQQFVGSEGTLGVITSATVRIRPKAESMRMEAFLFGDFEYGCHAMRRLEQAGLPLSIVRLSDAEETRWLSQAAESSPSLVGRIGRAVVERMIRRRGYDRERLCLALVSMEGDRAAVAAGMRRGRRIIASCGGIALGMSPGKNWFRDRFRHPYLRDELIARGVMVDTLETATTWSNLPVLYAGVRDALSESMEEAGREGVVLCHLSHIYPTGSSLYYTFMAKQVPGEELRQWQRIKDAATAAIVAGGGTLSHHHGIGYEHAPLAAENGPLAVKALAAAKRELDPTGIMNPGKLFSPGTERDTEP